VHRYGYTARLSDLRDTHTRARSHVRTHPLITMTLPGLWMIDERVKTNHWYVLFFRELASAFHLDNHLHAFIIIILHANKLGLWWTFAGTPQHRRSVRQSKPFHLLYINRNGVPARCSGSRTPLYSRSFGLPSYRSSISKQVRSLPRRTSTTPYC